MTLKNLLDSFEGCSLLERKDISLPSPVLLELLELKGADRSEEETRYYQKLVKNCPKFKIKGYCSEESDILTAEQIAYISSLKQSKTILNKSLQVMSIEQRQKRPPSKYDWSALGEKLRKENENKSFSVLSSYMPTERDIIIRPLSSYSNSIELSRYPLFKVKFPEENRRMTLNQLKERGWISIHDKKPEEYQWVFILVEDPLDGIEPPVTMAQYVPCGKGCCEPTFQCVSGGSAPYVDPNSVTCWKDVSVIL